MVTKMTGLGRSAQYLGTRMTDLSAEVFLSGTDRLARVTNYHPQLNINLSGITMRITAEYWH